MGRKVTFWVITAMLLLRENAIQYQKGYSMIKVKRSITR